MHLTYLKTHRAEARQTCNLHVISKKIKLVLKVTEARVVINYRLFINSRLFNIVTQKQHFYVVKSQYYASEKGLISILYVYLGILK